jgi:hypothetical protein
MAYRAEFELIVMPGLVLGIYVFVRHSKQDVDARVKPGHDGI